MQQINDFFFFFINSASILFQLFYEKIELFFFLNERIFRNAFKFIVFLFEFFQVFFNPFALFLNDETKENFSKFFFVFFSQK